MSVSPTATSSNQIVQRTSPEAALPPFILNLINLFLLEGQGEVVQFPDGMSSQDVYLAILDFFSPIIEPSSLERVIRASRSDSSVAIAPTTPILVPPSLSPLPDNFYLNLNDLLDLCDSGETVVWPFGFSPQSARSFIVDYRHAVAVCRLHRITPQ